jgi:BolA protein
MAGNDLLARVDSLLRERVAATHVEIIDESHLHAGHAGARGGGRHLRVLVVSPAFEGKAPLARHRLVNAALEVELRGEIHALALETRSPSEARPSGK